MANKPKDLIVGEKQVDSVPSQLTTIPTPIFEAVTVKIRELLSGATYVALGTETVTKYRLSPSDVQGQEIDFINDLSKVYAKTDSGSAWIEWMGG